MSRDVKSERSFSRLENTCTLSGTRHTLATKPLDCFSRILSTVPGLLKLQPGCLLVAKPSIARCYIHDIYTYMLVPQHICCCCILTPAALWKRKLNPAATCFLRVQEVKHGIPALPDTLRNLCKDSLEVAHFSEPHAFDLLKRKRN